MTVTPSVGEAPASADASPLPLPPPSPSPPSTIPMPEGSSQTTEPQPGSSPGPAAEPEKDHSVILENIHCLCSVGVEPFYGKLAITSDSFRFYLPSHDYTLREGCLHRILQDSSPDDRTPYWTVLGKTAIRFFPSPVETARPAEEVELSLIKNVSFLIEADPAAGLSLLLETNEEVRLHAADAANAREWKNAISSALSSFEANPTLFNIELSFSSVSKVRFSVDDNLSDLTIHTKKQPSRPEQTYSFFIINRNEDVQAALEKTALFPDRFVDQSARSETESNSSAGGTGGGVDQFAADLSVSMLNIAKQERDTHILSSCVMLRQSDGGYIAGRLYLETSKNTVGFTSIRWESLSFGLNEVVDKRMAESGGFNEIVLDLRAGEPVCFRFLEQENALLWFRSFGKPNADDTYCLIEAEKPKPMNITIATIGSTGDVLPYIALAKQLKKDDHTITIATHSQFQTWIESHGLRFYKMSGSPEDLMKFCAEKKTVSFDFFRDGMALKSLIESHLEDVYRACKETNANLLIETPSIMAGIHVAESLQIPFFRAFTMPWTKTTAFPHAFFPQTYNYGYYNKQTYTLFEASRWVIMKPAINKWRQEMLGIPPIPNIATVGDKVPFLYGVSPNVMEPPKDYPATTHVTGYWFLDEGSGPDSAWRPDPKLEAFIAKAKADGKKIYYVGFGSIVAIKSNLWNMVAQAARAADVRCILCEGWSNRDTDAAEAEAGSGAESSSEPDEETDAVFKVERIPHDWLFGQIDGAVHHGGCGTTGASLRFGLVTIVKPFFADQFFYGERVRRLGVGMVLAELSGAALTASLNAVTHEMVQNARELGARIRAERGVVTAVQHLYYDLPYSAQLIQERRAKSLRRANGGRSPAAEKEEDGRSSSGPSAAAAGPGRLSRVAGSDDASSEAGSGSECGSQQRRSLSFRDKPALTVAGGEGSGSGGKNDGATASPTRPEEQQRTGSWWGSILGSARPGSARTGAAGAAAADPERRQRRASEGEAAGPEMGAEVAAQDEEEEAEAVHIADGGWAVLKFPK